MFFLASELGMTIQELTSKLTQEEYINWLAYYELKKNTKIKPMKMQRINHEQENAKSGTLK